jgi:hypothetical protein
MFGLFGKPSHKKFAQIVADAAKQAGVTDELTFQEADFSLRHAKGIFSLGNLYDDYCAADREHKRTLLDNFVSAMVDRNSSVTRDEAFENCVAVIRERALFAFMDLRSQLESMKPAAVAFEPVSDWFVRSIVIDAPGFMKMVTRDHLSEWNVTFDELFEAGMERLRDCTPAKFAEQDGYFVGQWKDDYDSSRILVPELFEDLPVEGQPVFCTPNRLTLLVADSSDERSVVAMLTKAEEITRSEPRPYNPAPLTYASGELVDFEVSENSPVYPALQRVKTLTHLGYSDEQKELLEALHKKLGKDIFIAKFTMYELKSGGYLSMSVWSKGVVTLLPKTDVIMFFDGNKTEVERMVAVKWEDAQTVVGDLMLDAGMCPPRFYVSKFPSEEQLAEMPRQQV